MRKDKRFGTRIVWGTITIGFPVSWVAVPGCSQNGCRTCPNLGVQKKFIKIRQSIWNTRLRPVFLVTLPSISSETWEMYSWAVSGSSVFFDWLFLVLSGVSLETAANFLFILKGALILMENFCEGWRLNWSFVFNKDIDLLLLWGK